MKEIKLTVNGTERQASVEPRTSLADLLREDFLLTGTHLGCEQGVCGACTIYINGNPRRSCLALAVTCDGADVNTIESFDDDEVMVELRQAFSSEHALQCGYCTPGMLITARDIVHRLPDAGDNKIRHELSGNLCRCTGYVGIVRAIRQVLSDRTTEIQAGPGQRSSNAVTRANREPLTVQPPTPRSVTKERISEDTSRAGTLTELKQSFAIHQPRSAVWAVFQDLERIVPCMSGASLSEPPQSGHIKGRINVKLGPISANFSGEADIESDPSDFSGVIIGKGLDSGSSSRAYAEVSYKLEEDEVAASTKVNVVVAYSLSGTLAQFSRGGIVKAVAERLSQNFADNLEKEMSSTGKATVSEGGKPNSLNAGSLLFSVFWDMLKSIFDRSSRIS